MNDLANHGRWISEFGFFLLLALNLVTFVKLFLPQKREVSFAETYARRTELAALAAHVERLETAFEDLRNEIRDDRENLLLAGEDRIQRLHARLDALHAEMKADRDQWLQMRAECSAQLHRRINELVDGVHEKFDALSRRIEEMPLKIVERFKIQV